MPGPIQRAFARARRNSESATTHATSTATPQPATVTLSLDGTDTPTQTSTSRGSRVLVSTLREEYTVTYWMMSHAQDQGTKHIGWKCVEKFPKFFSCSSNANILKIVRWWPVR